jgi:hypothetical protein
MHWKNASTEQKLEHLLRKVQAMEEPLPNPFSQENPLDAIVREKEAKQREDQLASALGHFKELETELKQAHDSLVNFVVKKIAALEKLIKAQAEE